MFWPKLTLALFVWGAIIGLTSPVVLAQRVSPTLTPDPTKEVATVSAEASQSATPATSAAQLMVGRVVEKKEDITQAEPLVKGRLERYLDEQPVGPLNGSNFLQHSIRMAVKQGVPANTIVLILLFPVVAAIVPASRHLIGLRGFGIFVPAMLSVAFVATGVFAGITLFLVIMGMGTIGRYLLKYLRLQYLPRMALLLWLVSVAVLATTLVAPYLRLEALATVSIFPIMILMLLAENFVEVQYGKSPREARELTVETMILALISSLVLSLDFIQRFALLHPEMLLGMVFVFDVFMGRYVGLRFTEYRKFKKLLKD